MIQLFSLEIFKSKRRKLWFLPLAFLFVIGSWTLSVSLSYQNRGNELTWEYLIYQFGTINTLLISILIALIASRICDIEIKDGSLHALLPLSSPRKIYLVKFLYAGSIFFVTLVLEATIMSFWGNLFGIVGAAPVVHILEMYLGFLAISIVILALQQALSFLFTNQIIPIIIGIAGGFLGFMSLLFPPFVQKFVFWSYYANFSAIQMNYDPVAKTMSLEFLEFPWAIFIVCILLGIAFYSIGLNKFKKMEW